MEYAVYSFFLCELSSADSATSSTAHPAGFLPTPEEGGSTKDLHFLQAPLLFQLPSLSLLLPQRLARCQIFFWWIFCLWNACRSLPFWFCSSKTLQQQKVRARPPVLNYILKSSPMSKAEWIINQMNSMWPFMHQRYTIFFLFHFFFSNLNKCFTFFPFNVVYLLLCCSGMTFKMQPRGVLITIYEK